MLLSSGVRGVSLQLYCNQVNNRDISIAVLRTFISKRKQEHEMKMSRRTKAVQKLSNENASELETPSEPNTPNDKSNGECEESEEISLEEPCSISEEPVKIPEGKGRAELKPPRVLEVLFCNHLRKWVLIYFLSYLFDAEIFW